MGTHERKSHYIELPFLSFFIWHKFQEVLAGEEGVFSGEGIAGLFHILDDLFSWDQVVLWKAQLA